MPRSSGTLAGIAPSTVMRPSRSDERRARVPPDEREPAPALAVLDRFEQEAGAVTDELGVGRHRRLEIGQELGPDRDDGVVGGERAELLARRPQADRNHRSGLERRSGGRSTNRHRCGRRPRPPARPGTATCPRRSRSTPRARTGGRRSCRLCATAPDGCATSRPSCLRPASSAATRRSSRPSSGCLSCAMSCAMAATSPSALNVTAASCSGVASIVTPVGMRPCYERGGRAPNASALSGSTPRAG